MNCRSIFCLVIVSIISAGLPPDGVCQPVNPVRPMSFKVVDSSDPLVILKELNDLCHHIRSAAKNLITESTQADLITQGSASLLQTSVQEAQPGSLELSGYLQPRQKWVNFHMSHLAYLLPELKSQVDSMQIPSTVSGGAEMIADMKNELVNLTGYYNKLLADTKGPPYDGIALTADAGGVELVAGRVMKDQQDLEKIVKKAAK